jgi:hypothetical protein
MQQSSRPRFSDRLGEVHPAAWQEAQEARPHHWCHFWSEQTADVYVQMCPANL